MRPTIVLAALLFAAAPLPAQIISIPLGGPKKEKPSPNRDLLGSPAAIAAAVAMKGRPAGMTAHDATRQPAAVLTFLDLPLAARVLDVETDPGYYGEIMGSAVGPGGKVTMLVPPAAMRDAGQRRRLIELVGRVPNVALLAATPATATVAAGGFDFVLLHRLATGDAAGFARKLYAAVRPGGVVGVVGDAASTAALKPDFVRAGFVVDTEAQASRPPADAESAGDADRAVVRLVRPE